MMRRPTCSATPPLVLIAMVLLAAALLLARTATAQLATAGGEEPARVSNVFVDTDLRQALQDISAQAGVAIIPDAMVNGIVTADLQDVTVEQALDLVLAGTGYGVKWIPGGKFYLVYSSDPKGGAFNAISKTRVIRLDYALADVVQKMLSPHLQQYVRADPATNALLATAPEDVLERIERDVRLLDRAPRHVLLDARVVVLEQTDLLNLGVQWDFPQVQAGAFVNSDTGGNWPWGVQVGYTPGREFTNSLLLTLNLMTQNEQAAIVASPQVMAQDGKPASLTVTTDEYFQIVTNGLYVQADLEKIESGTILNIVPRIGENGEITMTMEIEVSDVVARGANNLPVVNRRTASSTIRVKSGGTAVVGGLMDTRAETIRREVPGAAGLPLVGHLFRNTASRNGTKQIAVFITASLVAEDPAEVMDGWQARPTYPAVDAEAFRASLRESLRRLGSGEDRT